MRCKIVYTSEVHGEASWTSIYPGVLTVEMAVGYHVEEYFEELTAEYGDYKVIYVSNGVPGVYAAYLKLIPTPADSPSRTVILAYVIFESSPYFNVFELTDNPDLGHEAQFALYDSNSSFIRYFNSPSTPPFVKTIRKIDKTSRVYSDLELLFDS